MFNTYLNIRFASIFPTTLFSIGLRLMDKRIYLYPLKTTYQVASWLTPGGRHLYRGDIRKGVLRLGGWICVYFFLGLAGLYREIGTLFFCLILLTFIFISMQYEKRAIKRVKIYKTQYYQALVSTFVFVAFSSSLWLSARHSEDVFKVRLVRVTSESMSPTIVKGDLVLASIINSSSIKMGSIVLYKDSKKGYFAIKRIAKKPIWLKDQSNTRSFYLLGDNASKSYDSRHFGTVERNQVIGQIEGILVPSDISKLSRYFKVL